GQPSAGQGAHGLAHQVPGGQVHRLGPAGGHQFTGLLVPHQGGFEHIRRVLPGVGETVLIGDPLFVHRGVVTGQAAHHHAAPVVHPDGRTARVVFGDGGAGHQVEGAGAEPVGGRGQCPHRADLDRVAGEVGSEGAPGGVLVGRGHGPGAAFGGRDQGGLPVRAYHVVLEGGLAAFEVQVAFVEPADLLPVQPVHVVSGSAAATALQVDERVAGDLVGEPGAALAQDAPVPVQQDLRGDLDRLGEGAFDAGEPGSVGTVGV